MPAITPSFRRLRFAMPASLLLACVALFMVACSGDDEGDGPEGWIVYERSERAESDIFAINPASGETRQLVDREGYDGNPSWSPDRTEIVFASDRDAAFQVNELYIMAADGSNVRRVTNSAAAEWNPRFSPDGSQIAFVRREDSEYRLMVVNRDGSDERAVAGPYMLVEFPDWTKDGDRLIFSALEDTVGGADLLGVDLATGEVRPVVVTDGADVCPHVTPDGKQLIYASGDAEGNLDLYVRDLALKGTDNSQATRLTDAPGRDDYGNPSPDGSHIVFISDRDGDPELYVMKSDGSGEARLTSTKDIRENLPSW